MFQRYLEKNTLKPPLITAKPAKGTALIVVIPVYKEKSVLQPLKALQEAIVPRSKVEVILVFNASENEEEVLTINQACKEEALNWYASLSQPSYALFCIEENQLPRKHAGVGLARKIGMDEALRRFQTLQEWGGIIICFDADSSCAQNYLKAIEEHFQTYPKTPACSIYFEHPINSKDFSHEINLGIAFYELHLRYYKNGLTYAGLPYDFYTVGSSMAVRARAYSEEGGMNKRKAGEDFYFLQKMFKKGNFTSLYNTTVIPSPRISDRVPFGTGRAILEMLNQERNIENSYAFSSFEVLKNTFSNVEKWYAEEPKNSSYLAAYFGEQQLADKLSEIRTQSTSLTLFIKRLFQWFDAFQCLKFIHFLRDNYFENKPLIEESSRLLKASGIAVQQKEVGILLEIYRKKDREEGS